MMLNHFFIIVTFIIAAITIAGCDALKMDYVPTPGQIMASHGTFLVAPKSVTGHYANKDVDSVVFSYTTEAQDSDAFWQSVDTAADTANWTHIYTKDNERHYERLIPRTGQRIFNSAEQVRVSFDSSNGYVVVAWVQADSTNTVKQFSQTGESSFAESAVWPRFRALAGPTKGVTKR